MTSIHSSRRSRNSNHNATDQIIVPPTRLSDILSPSAAVEVLGHDQTRNIIRNFLRCGCSPQATTPSQPVIIGGLPNLNTSTLNEKQIRYRHSLDAKESNDEREEIDLLLFGLSYDFNNIKNNVDQETKQRVSKAWSKLGFVPVSGYELDLTTEFDITNITSSYDNNKTEGKTFGGGISSHSVSSDLCPPSPKRGRSLGSSDVIGASSSGGAGSSSHHIRSPIPSFSKHSSIEATPITYSVEALFAHSLRQYQTVLGIDKTSFITRGILFPPTSVPDRGPNGHMALMDCIFNALSTTPPDPSESGLMEDAVGAAAALTAKAAAMAKSNGNSNATTVVAGHGSTNKGNFVKSSADDRLGNVMGGGRGKPRILLPDLLIMFAICRLGKMELEYRGYLDERRIKVERKQVELSAHIMDLEHEMDGTGRSDNGDEKMMMNDDGLPPTEDLESINDNNQHNNIPPLPPPPRKDGLLLASLLIFRVYDGYQRQNNLTRDTIQRFLSDIHGEESYKAPPVRMTLDKLFSYIPPADPEGVRHDSQHHPQPGTISNGPSPRILNAINPDVFSRGIHSTLSFSPRPMISGDDSSSQSHHHPSVIGSHILLDWMLTLFNCMLPSQLPPPSKVCEHHLRIVNSDPARMIDALSTKYGLYDGDSNDPHGIEGDNALYEIRRRFHSVEQHNNDTATQIAAAEEVDGAKKLDPPEADVDVEEDATYEETQLEEEEEESPSSSAVGAANVCPETGALLIPEEDESLSPTSSASSTLTRPKNVINEGSFAKAVAHPNNELGHGGYLPPELARWTFRACAGRAEELRERQSGNLWYENNEIQDETTKDATVTTKKSTENEKEKDCYWTIYDVLSFGCEAVRYDAVKDDNTDVVDVGRIPANLYEKYGSEIPLLRLAFKTFQQLPNQMSDGEEEKSKMLTRAQIGKMILLLLEHESFRLEADSPLPSPTDDDFTPHKREARKPWSKPTGDIPEDDEYLRDMGTDDLQTTLVDASFASLLGLLPSKLDLSQFGNTTSTEDGKESSHSIPLSILVDYVIAEANATHSDLISLDSDASSKSSIDFTGFVNWHLHLTPSENNKDSSMAMSVRETRLGPYLLDLRLIASVLFGVRPASAPMEQLIIEEIKRRHKYRYPRSRVNSSQPRGPCGTVWYVISAEWWRTWEHYTEGKVVNGGSYTMGKIDNNSLLSEEGILSLKQGLHWHQDFELVEPLVWSALQAWHDGGPPITREVVPFNPHKTEVHNHMSYSPSRSSGMDEEYEIELYPLYASVFLCDKVSRGEPRPFQQFIPLSRYLPLQDVVYKLREGLGRNDKLKKYDSRLWLMDSANVTTSRSAPTPGKDDDTLGWILDLDLTIGDERNLRGAQLGKDENISLMLELRNEDGAWPRSKTSMSGATEDEEDDNDTNEERDEMALGDGIVGLYNMG